MTAAADQPTLTPVPSDPAPAQLHHAAARDREPLSLLRKLNEIFLEVPPELPADADGPQNQFRYASINAVFGHLREPLATKGILVIPAAGTPVDRPYKTSSGKDRVASVVPAHFTFVDTETGERLGPIEWVGGGQDDAEKGGSKGATNAVRTFLLSFFQISVTGASTRGGSGGQRSGGDPNKPASKAQQDLVERIAREVELGSKEFMNVLRAARGLDHIDVSGETARNACAEHLGNLTSEQASALIQQLRDAKRKRAAS